MPHMVETMAYAGDVPWHKLGAPVSNDLTPEEMARAAQIDWRVEKSPVYQLWDDAYWKVEGKHNLVRQTDGKVLDVVGDVYKPVQNVEMLDFFSRFVKAGHMSMETAGSLDGGRRIWGLARIGKSFTLKGGDQTDAFLMLSNAHKQGFSFLAKVTGVRVVCMNTHQMALEGAGAAWKMSHAAKFDGDMQKVAMETLGLAIDRFEEYHQAAEALSNAKVPGKLKLLEYVATLSGQRLLDATIAEQDAAANGSVLDAVLAASHGAREVKKVTSEADLNSVGRTILDSILNSPGSDLASARGTWYGAVNGVTHAVDHRLGKTDDSRLTSAWFGPRAALKQQAVTLAMQYAGVSAN